MLLGVLCLYNFSCREIQPYEIQPHVNGYRLDGTVTTANGVPIKDVDVRLYYYYHRVSDTPIDTQRVYVADSTRIVDVAVYCPDNTFVRQLFLGYRAPGYLPRYRWDGFDYNGVPAPGGKYLIRYVVDTAIVKYSPVLLDGRTTATTDVFGQFTLDGNRLPIGDRFDIYDFANMYFGTYEVTPEIDIRLKKLTLSKLYTAIILTKDNIITRSFTLE